MDFFDDGPVKPVRIWSRIGRRPILAAGNSNGDIQMLRYAGGKGRPALRLLVLHDDAEREFDYTAGAETCLEQAEEQNWTVVSVKNDWADGVRQPQLREDPGCGSGVAEVGHRDVGDDLADVVQRGELVGVEALVGREVRDLDAQQVVEVARDVVALDDLGDRARALLEALDVLALVADETDRDEGGQPAAVGLRVDDRPVAADHLLVLEAS